MYNSFYTGEVFSPQFSFCVEARMMQVECTPEAIAALHYERYHHPHPRVQRKMDVFLLKSHGLSHKKIACITRVSVLGCLKAPSREPF